LNDRPDQTKAERAGYKVIDWAILSDICDDEDIITEIAKAILEDGPRNMQFITDSIKAASPEDVQLYAHSLKGAAMTIGACRLSQSAYRLECAARQQDMQTVRSLFEEVKSEFTKVKSFLSRDNWIDLAKKQESDKNDELLEINARHNR
jgi:HPt (histidine-containing phosphotransfer) domain-containing protein